LAASCATSRSNDTWFADSGATRHMTGHLEWFCDIKMIAEGQWPIRGISSQVLYARGIGRINIDRIIEGEWHTGSLEEVLYKHDLPRNLFFLSRVASKGVDTTCSRNRCYLTIDNRIIMEGVMENMLYRLLNRVKPPEVCLYTANLGTSNLSNERQLLQTWHYRLSHLNHEAIRRMANSGLVDGLQLTSTTEDNFCEGCAKGKQHRHSFPTNNPRTHATVLGELIHTDLCGPMSTRSLGGAYYIAVYKDDCTCYQIVHCITHKLDVQRTLPQAVQQIQRETSHSVQK
jgi:hypothetical protein